MNTDVASPPAVHGPEAGTVVLTINGQVRELQIEARVSLLDALREHLALTGSKKGCDQGTCGARTVWVDSRRVLACLTFAVTRPDSAFLAGGTTEVDLVRQDVLRPGLLVDINDLPLTGVEDLPGGGLRHRCAGADERRGPGARRGGAVPGDLAGAAGRGVGAAAEHGLDRRQPVPAGAVQLLPRRDLAVQ